MDHSRTPSPQPIDCLKCRHFQVTWEANHPRACRAMGFKTALWPWQEVMRSSGEPCLRFDPKSPSKPGGKQENKPFNPPPSDRFSRLV